MSQACPERSALASGSEYVELQRLIFWVLWSMVLQIAIVLVVQFIGGSQTIRAVLIDSSTSLLLHIFNIISIGIILRQNPFSHPYGTGKLENFSGFLYAILAIPGGLWILYSAYGSYLQPPPTANLGMASFPLLFAVVRAAVLFWMAGSIVRCHAQPSPMTKAYLVNMRVTAVTNLLLLTGVLIGFGVSLTDHSSLAIYADISIAALTGLYLLYSATQVLLANFNSLIDLPLPEADQLKIMQALTAHFDAYEDIGKIYTQLSGSTRLVHIELYVKPDTTAAEIQSLSTDMESRLKDHFGKLLFHMIPLVRDRT